MSARALRMAVERTGAMMIATAMLKVVAGSLDKTATMAPLAVTPLKIMVSRGAGFFMKVSLEAFPVYSKPKAR